MKLCVNSPDVVDVDGGARHDRTNEVGDAILFGGWLSSAEREPLRVPVSLGAACRARRVGGIVAACVAINRAPSHCRWCSKQNNPYTRTAVSGHVNVSVAAASIASVATLPVATAE